MKGRKTVLTDQELEIMKIVWQVGTATVRDVYEELLKSRKVAYTTVMTMMGILEQKGRLTKALRDRAYVYWPAEPQAEVVGSMVHDFVKRVFDGSAKPLLVHLIENKELSAKEFAEISRLMKKQKRRT
jgi:BlaI family transcriptional regulator, penicillinase repressor